MHTSPDLLALLALGEEAGTAEDLAHLAECAFCRTELAALTAAASRARGTTERDVLVAPRPEVWQRIREELQLGTTAPTLTAVPPVASATQPVSVAAGTSAARTSAAGTSAAGSEPSRLGRRTRLAAFALAAVLALVVGIGLGANLDRILPGSEEVASTPLNALPSWQGAQGRATVEADREGNRFLVVQVEVPGQATGLREVWLTNSRADTMYALGYLEDDSGRFPIPPNVDLKEFQLVDISHEPADDRDFHHSGNSVLRGKLPV